MTNKTGRTKHHKKVLPREILAAYVVLGVLSVCSIGLLFYGLVPEKRSEEGKEMAASVILPETQEVTGIELPSENAPGADLDGSRKDDSETVDDSETMTPDESADGDDTAAAAGGAVPLEKDAVVSSTESAKPASEVDSSGVMESGIGSLPEILQLPAGSVVDAGQVDFSNPAQYFAAIAIEKGDSVYQRINGRSWQENPYLLLGDLRYLKMLHYNFEGQIQVGEMIVNKSIAEDVCNAFAELFACGYQIQSMYLIDNYWTGDPEDSDTASVDANNSSAFCYRPATDGANLSMHAYGKAVDINPQQNPYVYYRNGIPRWYHTNADDYIDRNAGLPHMIDHEDAAFHIFSKYGFLWGGDWKNQKDYQHFQKK